MRTILGCKGIGIFGKCKINVLCLGVNRYICADYLAGGVRRHRRVRRKYQKIMEQVNIYSGKEIISRVFVKDGTDALGECLRPYRNVFAVIDARVAGPCAEIVGVLEKRAVKILRIETSEESKNLETVMTICSWLLSEGADRDALVLAVGGGITSDMVGFAASIYKRGVRFAYVPTTLLAQVDAAIGGKTGVNFETLKNILGVIRQPEFTYICPQPLETLPQRDFLSGAAEMVKTFIIEDGGNYEKVVDLLWNMSIESDTTGKPWGEIVREHKSELTGLIAAAARVKAGVVSRDQFENGERRKLNLGHTFAHAIESLAQKRAAACGAESGGESGEGGITHGEAVAMGMVFAARLADKIYGYDEENSIAARIETELWDCNIPSFCPFEVEEMAEAMRKDKKAEWEKVHFVLPKGIGDVVIKDLTVAEVVEMLK